MASRSTNYRGDKIVFVLGGVLGLGSPESTVSRKDQHRSLLQDSTKNFRFAETFRHDLRLFREAGLCVHGERRHRKVAGEELERVAGADPVAACGRGEGEGRRRRIEPECLVGGVILDRAG